MLMPVELVCNVCGEIYKTKPSHAARRKYCSIECVSKAFNKNIEKTCIVCGKTFKVPNNKHRKDAKYCSTTCHGKGMRGENHPLYKHGRGNKGTKEQQRLWYLSHRSKPGNVEKWNERVRRRKLKEKGIEPAHTTKEWKALLAKYEYRCYYCGVKITKEEGQNRLTRDHYIPISKGGSDKIENIVPSCKSCNGRKADRPAEEVFETFSE